jgi:hypothetical protein
LTPEQDSPERSLYALPPEGFVAARNEAVAQARADGDAALATRLAALRRPTVAAWLVNLLAQRRPEQIGELLDLGTALREAQHQLRGERLRELSARRRSVITGLVAQARRVAAEAGRRPGDSLPLAEVEATLAAAVADEDLAAAVRAGRLTRATGYAGFGEAPRPDLRVIEGGGREGGGREGGGREGRSAERGRRLDTPTERAGRAGRAGAGRGGETGSAAAGRGGETGRAAAERDGETGRAVAGRDGAAARAASAERAREEAARAARVARIEAAEAELRRATADEQDAARALAEISTELDRLRERHTAAHTALREARQRRRAAEREARRFGG